MSKDDRISAKKAELKTKHEDWDDAKLVKTASMLVGREIKDEENKVIRDAHEKQLGDAITADNPGIEEKELAKKVKQAIAKEELDIKKADADADIETKYQSMFNAIVARAKLDDTKQADNTIPKDVKDAIEKIQKLTI